MGKLIEMVGKRFDSWLVIKCLGRDKWRQAMWLCLCECGRERIVKGYALRKGRSKCCKSCQVKKQRTTHGQCKTSLYSVWANMIDRCENPNNKGYKWYGNRGIRICSAWRKDFIAFRRWALKHGYKEGLQIDRIDNNHGYEPSNCRFVTAKEQNRNRRDNRYIKIGNKVKLLCEWAELTGIKRQTLTSRIHYNFPEHRLLEPVRKKQHV